MEDPITPPPMTTTSAFRGNNSHDLPAKHRLNPTKITAKTWLFRNLATPSREWQICQVSCKIPVIYPCFGHEYSWRPLISLDTCPISLTSLYRAFIFSWNTHQGYPDIKHIVKNIHYIGLLMDEPWMQRNNSLTGIEWAWNKGSKLHVELFTKPF